MVWERKLQILRSPLIFPSAARARALNFFRSGARAPARPFASAARSGARKERRSPILCLFLMNLKRHLVYKMNITLRKVEDYLFLM